MSDDGGVLGRLPNERPGRRSEKRAPTARTQPRPRTPEATPRPSEEGHPGDPVSDAIRTATGLAAAGARVANGVAREVVRRLPRL